MKKKLNSWKSNLVMGCLLTLQYSCSLFDPASPTASFIVIDSISVYSDYASQGSNSARVFDAWVIVDNSYLGTFPLPATIPIIGEGNHAIKIKAGIIENGIAALRSAFPKYSSFDTTVFLQAGKKLALQPRVTYEATATFPQIEDFDDASISFSTTTVSTLPVLITPANDTNALESNSGFVTLDATHTVFEIATSVPFVLPLSTPTYLEIDHKGDNDFSIGVYINTSSNVQKTSLISFRASQEWKKEYVSLNALGGIITDGIAYKIFIHADKDPAIANPTLYFDNVKVVY
jgi:hypothetical protein